jgi:hypothetical protein
MNETRNWLGRCSQKSIVKVILISAILVQSGLVFAHGGKTHTSSFTALQALQKATELYDRLVGGGKLEETWETGLAKVSIVDREKKGLKEYVVSFERSKGDPKTVYIFLTDEGKYAGSNFTGK